MNVLSEIAVENEQARPLSELEYPVEAKLVSDLFGKLQLVVADLEGRRDTAIGGFDFDETMPYGVFERQNVEASSISGISATQSRR